jgi:hypothetical protein
MRNIPWYIPVLGVLLVIGAVGRDTEQSATPTPTPTTIPTVVPTVDRTCYIEYHELVVDTINKITQANSIDAVDALIYRYDNVQLPYGCGNRDLLDKTDMSVRLALAEARTVFMSKTPTQHAVNSVIHQQEAMKTVNEWKNE